MQVPRRDFNSTVTSHLFYSESFLSLMSLRFWLLSCQAGAAAEGAAVEEEVWGAAGPGTAAPGGQRGAAKQTERQPCTGRYVPGFSAQEKCKICCKFLKSGLCFLKYRPNQFQKEAFTILHYILFIALTWPDPTTSRDVITLTFHKAWGILGNLFHLWELSGHSELKISECPGSRMVTVYAT